MIFFYTIAIIFCSFFLTIPDSIGAEKASISQKKDKKKILKGVVIFSRHGVRVPHITGDFNLYSDKKWPDWGLPAYYLTKHGYNLARGMGFYYSKRYKSILEKHGRKCSVINKMFSRADNEQRTVKTAEAFLEGLIKNQSCNGRIFYMPYKEGDKKDPYFHPVPTVCKMLYRKSQESREQIYKKKAQNKKLRVGLALMQKLTNCCDSSLCSKDVFCTLDNVDVGKGKKRTKSSFAAGNSIAEAFILQKAQGFSKKDIAWGQLNTKDWKLINDYHATMKNIEAENRYWAKREFSNITNYLLQALENIGSRGKYEKPDITIIVGHDTNFEFISRMLGLSWQLPEYGVYQVPPTSAWIFEVYTQENSNDPKVDVFFVGQSLDKMNKGLLANKKNGAPDIVPVAIEPCQKENSCSLKKLIKYGIKKLDMQCVLSIGKE